MIKNKIQILLAVLAVFSLFLSSSTAVKSKTDDQINREIEQLNRDIQQNKDKMAEIERRKGEYAEAIKEKQTEAINLKNQMAILDNRIAKAELDIENVKGQIDEVNLEMQRTLISIGQKESEIEKEKRNIANTLKLIYRENDAGSLEILLMNDSLADFLNRIKYLEDINKENKVSLDSLKNLKNELEQNKAELEVKNEELANLKVDLEQSKISLEEENNNKKFILEATRGSEKEYQNLLEQVNQEQINAANEIANLEKTVREKLKNLSSDKLEFNDNGLIWPVTKNYVTTFFHDPDYPFRYLFEHPAVDIRAAQGSTIKAAASGYVARVKLKGSSYGYIMLIHGDGISTVYGHISKALVAEDEYVIQGQPIALSGGLPGTTGAGPYTTGAHLHFEVRQDGIPVNPQDYLP